MEKFDIRIKDDFLESSKFKVLYDKVPFYNYQAGGNYIKDVNHIWYSIPASEDVTKYLKEECEKQFDIKLKTHFCSITMLATVEPRVHCDYGENCTHQVIVYIRGNEDLHKGTGFYVSKDDFNELNTHVGFHKNRAVLFESGMYHSPLVSFSDDSIPRISIIARF